MVVRADLWLHGNFRSFLFWTALPVIYENTSPVIRISVNIGFKALEGQFPLIKYVEIVQTDMFDDPGASALAPIDSLGSSTDSEAAWRLMSQWITKCVKNHVDYGIRNHEAKSWYPTRLLDLGEPESRSAPRLIHTASDMPSGPYLTLSHCWGKGSHICAVQDNLKSLSLGVHGLPRTFEHAVAATRKLGYRYLWIDSLCIVQDDHQDWAYGSALMHQVYTNAACNLAAAASEDSSGGLFFDRRGLHGQCVAQYARHGQVYSYLDQRLFDRDICYAPLQQRAWVHQEWLMAKRTIHFARNQVFWECDHLCACEVFPHGLPKYIEYEGKKTFAETLNKLTSLKKSIVALEAAESQLPFNIRQQLLWIDFVCNYAGRELTNLSWWATYSEGSRLPYRAPSWSWASLERGITWHTHFRRFTPGMKILEASTTCQGSDPTGIVSGGYLVVKGNLSRVNIIDDELDTTFDDQRPIHEPSPTEPDPACLPKSGLSPLGSELLDEMPRVAFRGFDTSDAESGQYYILTLLKDFEVDYKYSEEPKIKEFLDIYLVLRPLAERNGSFERCGLVHEFYTEINRHQRVLMPRVLAHNQDIPCEEYMGPEEGYKIRIV
ncbi:hypothetical protein FSARC_14653 [Fusarium sarcochroum]|uniref:Heterokaryon incompatibility domain-containing protein n=1 Tax=Fusarium sarcochroum TaxID=1208366 RepID=A0A8H4WN34_9HYPO|nr:hypothetical protein FSARC_14653 [Fusarium sarcochroum]